MNVQILVDNKNSWFVPYAIQLTNELHKLNHHAELIHEHSQIKQGDVLFLLSCEKLLAPNLMKLNKHNIVVHGSALPEGKGWSPLTWQVLEGKKKIPHTLFEASERVDAGEIYLQEDLVLDGLELIDELRSKQANTILNMVLRYVDDYQVIKGKLQIGGETFYKKRTAADSKLDINKSIKDQFNLLRVCDNDRYPAFFELDGKKFVLKIFREE